MKVKILSIFLVMVVFLGQLTVGVAVEQKKGLSFEFSNKEPGSAAGKITLTLEDGTYNVFWADENGQKLSKVFENKKIEYSELTKISVQNSKAQKDIHDFTAIPEGAKKIIAVCEQTQQTVAEYQIPQEKIFDYSNCSYSYGVLSDVHYNRYFDSGEDVAIEAFSNALDYMDDFGVSAVAISGDLTVNGEEKSLKAYSEEIEKREYPVFSCTGNHDELALKTDVWSKYVNSDVYKEKTNMPGVLDVNENNLDFVWENPESSSDDVFVFLNQLRNKYIIEDKYNSKEWVELLNDQQLDWLENQLEKHKNKTVYLFFHSFFATPDGQNEIAIGNLKNDAGYSYSLVYPFGNSDEKRFRKILEKNKNVVMFNGHSHLMYCLQDINTDLNIGDYDGAFATVVHVSSVTSPRYVTQKDYEVQDFANQASEGYLVSVYEDRLVLTAVDFFNGKFLSYATYMIDTESKFGQGLLGFIQTNSTSIIVVGAALVAIAGVAIFIKTKKKKIHNEVVED